MNLCVLIFVIVVQQVAQDNQELMAKALEQVKITTKQFSYLIVAEAKSISFGKRVLLEYWREHFGIVSEELELI